MRSAQLHMLREHSMLRCFVLLVLSSLLAPALRLRKPSHKFRWYEVYATKDLNLANDAEQTLVASRGTTLYCVGEREGKPLIASMEGDVPAREKPKWEVEETDIADVFPECSASMYSEWDEWDVCRNAEDFRADRPSFITGCTGMQTRQRVRVGEENLQCPEKQFEHTVCALDETSDGVVSDLNGHGEELAAKVWPDLASMSMGSYSQSLGWPRFATFKAPRGIPVSPMQNGKPFRIHKLAKEARVLARASEKLPVTNKGCAAGVRWIFLGELCHYINESTVALAAGGIPGAGEGSDCASVHRHRSTGAVAIAFRGTDSGAYAQSTGDWKFNNDIGVSMNFHGYMVPRGFATYYQLFVSSSSWVRAGSVSPELTWEGWLALARAAPQVWITGHSLGAATATLHMLELQATGICPPQDDAKSSKCGVVTFAAPRLFEKAWVQKSARREKALCACSDFARCARIWSDLDFVVRKPKDYVHGKLHSLRIDEAGKLTLEQVGHNSTLCTCSSKSSFWDSAVSTASGDGHSIKRYGKDLWQWASNGGGLPTIECETKHWQA